MSMITFRTVSILTETKPGIAFTTGNICIAIEALLTNVLSFRSSWASELFHSILCLTLVLAAL